MFFFNFRHYVLRCTTCRYRRLRAASRRQELSLVDSQNQRSVHTFTMKECNFLSSLLLFRPTWISRCIRNTVSILPFLPCSFSLIILRVSANEDDGVDWHMVQVTSADECWLVQRNYENFKMLDAQLHQCIFDRKISKLPDLSSHPSYGEDIEVIFLLLSIQILVAIARYFVPH